jgi:hypothetical protein
MTSFGLLSPFDFVSILTLVSEIFSHLFVIYSMTKSSTHILVLLFSVVSSILPLVLPRFSDARSHPDYFYSPAEAACAEKQEKMRHLAHSDPHRPEILLFGLSPWILSSWAHARKTLLRLEKPSFFRETAFFGQVGLSEILVASQHVRSYATFSFFRWIVVRYRLLWWCNPPPHLLALSLCTEHLCSL